MARTGQARLSRSFVVTQIDQAKLYLRLHQDRFDEKEKIGWRNRKLRWIGGHLYALPKLFSQTAPEGPLNGLPGFAGYIRDMPESTEDAGKRFSELVNLMRRLRAPGGCPWDRKQTFDSIKPYTLEETYEVLDAIDSRDWNDLSEELGDFLLQAVFYAQMAGEQNLFAIDDALDAINQKLIRRHPHVFAAESAETAGDVKRIW